MVSLKSNIRWLSCLLCLIFNTAFADEINRYHVDITVLENGKIDVIETLGVRTDHEMIKLGITREIPTVYYFMNKRVKTPVQVLSVTRNGKPENFWLENNSDYVEIFTGSVDNAVDNYLDKGQHTYVIHWQSQNHVRSFKDYDELYINAIGHNWRLPIYNSAVNVTLPSTVRIIQAAAYHGSIGATNLLTSTQENDQTVKFLGPSQLGQGVGLTVAVGFTKDIIPSIEANGLDVMVDALYGELPAYIHPFNLVLFAIMLVLFGYYWLVKTIHRALSPQTKRVFTVRFEPPKGSLSYLFAILKPNNQAMDQAIVAILLDMHAKGSIVINKAAKAIQLGADRQTPVDFVDRMVVKAIKKQKTALSFEEGSKPWRDLVKEMSSELYFMNDSYYRERLQRYWYAVFPLIIVMIVSSVLCFFIRVELFLSLIFVGIALQLLLIPSVKAIWQKKRAGGFVSCIPTIISRIPFLAFGAVFVTLPFFVIFVDVVKQIGSRDLLIIYLLVIATLLTIRKLLIKLYSKVNVLNKKHGEIHQELLEFKHFLQYTKYEEYKLVTPEIYEQYLPYSIILGVEKTWLKRYQKYHPVEFAQSMMIALAQTSHHSMGQSVSRASHHNSSTTSSGYGRSGFGSGGGGSSGGGSGGGGGGGR